MAACVLCRRVARFCSLTNWRRSLSQSKHTHVKPEDDINDEEENKVFQHQENAPQRGYRLHYKPSSYRHAARNSVNSRHKTDHEEEERCLTAGGPSFWQQGNRYSVSCSRRLSSSKNTLLDLAFNKLPGPEVSSALPYRKPAAPDVKIDTRAFLKYRPGYASTTLDLTQRPPCSEWEEVLPLLQNLSILKGKLNLSEVSQLLVKLSKLRQEKLPLLRSDQRFVILLLYCVEHIHLFSLPQLLELLQSFVWLGIPFSHSALEALEAELSRRANQMSLHQLLFAADLWRCIGRLVPEFLQHVYELVRPHLGEMGVSEAIHLLYIMGEGRHCPKNLIRPLDQLLMRVLPQLYPEEIGTVCLGLFKSQTSITEDAVTRIVDSAVSYVNEMSDFALVNVMKYLRFSYLFHREWLEAMAREVPRRANRMGIQGLMHVTLTCSALHYHNDGILNAIAKTIPSLVPHCRSKDSCKLLWAFGTLGFVPSRSPAFYPSLTESLRQRKAEFQRYPEHLLTGLLGLAFISQFPEDLVALALTPDFVNLALKKTHLELRKDLFTLDGAVAMEVPQWTGPRLSSELREEVAEMLWKFAQSDLCHKLEVLEAESSLQDLLGGEKFVCKRMILPYTRSIDLEVHLDSAGQPVPVNPPSPVQNLPVIPPNQGWEKLNSGVTISDELFTKLTNGKSLSNSSASSAGLKPVSPLRLPPDECDRLFHSVLDLTSDLPKNNSSTAESHLQSFKNPIKVAVQISSRNHYSSTRQLLGLYAMKRRHLKIAGYRVVDLSHHEWTPLLRKSRAEKLAYLHCKIYDCL